MDSPTLQVKTLYPVASDSYDYTHPQGAVKDNSKNLEFNRKLELFPGPVLDLGCAGGGFVKDCIDSGRLAVGLEGTDFGLKNKTGEWGTIPDNLFTCDITKDFMIFDTETGIGCSFAVVTAWEVMEHIQEKDIPVVLANVKTHLKDDGLFICTISSRDSKDAHDPSIDLHRTQKPLDWWLNVFAKAGFYHDVSLEQHFGRDLIRWEDRSYHLFFRKI